MWNKINLILICFLSGFGIAKAQDITFPTVRNGYDADAITIANRSLDLQFGSSITLDSLGTVYIIGPYHLYRCDSLSKGAEQIADEYDVGYPAKGFVSGANNLFFSSFAENTDCVFKYDLKSNKIEKIGNSVKGSQSFKFPNGVFVDHFGNLYVADRSYNRIQKWTPGAQSGITVAGGHGRGSKSNQLDEPWTVFVDTTGAIYIHDAGNGRIQKWLPGAKSGTTIISNVMGRRDFFMDSHNNIYLLNGESVELWMPGASAGMVVAGGYGKGAASSQLDDPSSIWVDANGNLFVCDLGNKRIQKFLKVNDVDAYIDKAMGKVQQTNTANSPAHIKPPLAGSIVFEWLKPISGVDYMPDSIFRTNQSTCALNAQIIASGYIDESKIRLTINGKILSDDSKARVVQLKKSETKASPSGLFTYDFSTNIKLQSGVNRIQISYDAAHSESLNIEYVPGKLNLYILSIGTNKSLRFAVKDAIDFANIFKGNLSLGKYYNPVYIHTLTGNAATADSISESINELSQRPLREDDVLLVFISSHGDVINNRYRIMGSDFDVRKSRTSVDFQDEIADPLKTLGGKVFIFLDACYSGSSISEGSKNISKADINKEIDRMILSSDDLTIITSSSGLQESWEDESWQNGAFTKALKEALSLRKADANRDGVIDIGELFDYLLRRVPELVKAANKRNLFNEPATQTPSIKNPKGNVAIYVY